MSQGIFSVVFSLSHMNAAEHALQALREEVSKLELRVKELSEENRDLRDICDKNDIDYERAEILANLLTGDSLEALATRGLHGGRAGTREDKINAVIDYLYKGSFGRDLYTNTPIRGATSDQGHLESNSRGGVRLRPELALINQMLGDSEGLERLQRIDQAKRRINAAGSFTQIFICQG